MELFGVILVTIISSLYIFPFEFSFLPGINTKMMLAVCGLLILAYNMLKGEPAKINNNLFQLSLWALIVSFFALLSVILNNTPETTYVTYIVSMWVWLSGAYTMVSVIKAIHGKVSIILVGNYMLAVAVFQCIFGLLNQNFIGFNHFTNSLVGDMGFAKSLNDLDQAGRLYGIGAALDVAGTRFSAILVIISVIVSKIYGTKLQKYLFVYLISFIFVSIIANMISRTTIVGVALAFVYWGYLLLFERKRYRTGINKVFFNFIIILIISLPIIIYLYNHNSSFSTNLRFGFEGFFALIEKGSWETNSNDILLNMYKLPDNLRTWLIGDGYFENPLFDPNYIGYQWKGFYMGTDVGYLRFLFYFGILGLIAFSCFILKVGITCICTFPSYRDLFILLLLVNFVVWFKVSTDIFVMFAPFLCFSTHDNEQFQASIEELTSA